MYVSRETSTAARDLEASRLCLDGCYITSNASRHRIVEEPGRVFHVKQPPLLSDISPTLHSALHGHAAVGNGTVGGQQMFHVKH